MLRFAFLFCLSFFIVTTSYATSEKQSLSKEFITLITSYDDVEIEKSLSTIKKNWHPSLFPMALETYSYTQSFFVRQSISELIENESHQEINGDINSIYFWLWNNNIQLSIDYADFKAKLYRRIDRRFEKYFLDRQETARIRLDEIRWGGVFQDGIPHLRYPKMLTVKEADYLEDDHILFGIKINSDTRAYSKRILAWHEIFTDTIGGVPIAGVYCTLCGTVIPY